MVLGMAVAGVAHRKMRPRLLGNQNRQLLLHIAADAHLVGRGVCSDGKFADGKGLVLRKDCLLKEGLIFRLCREIVAGIGLQHSVLEGELQVLKGDSVDAHLRHMKRSLGSRKHRRGEHLADGNVDVRTAVFEVRLLRGIRQGVKHHLHICLVLPASGHRHVSAAVEHVDNLLLNLFIMRVRERVAADGLAEHFLEVVADGRHRIRNDGKSALLGVDKVRNDGHETPLQFPQERCRAGLCGRHRALVFKLDVGLAEDLLHRRSGISAQRLAVNLHALLDCGEALFNQRSLQHQKAVVSMVIAVLAVYGIARDSAHLEVAYVN